MEIETGVAGQRRSLKRHVRPRRDMPANGYEEAFCLRNSVVSIPAKPQFSGSTSSMMM